MSAQPWSGGFLPLAEEYAYRVEEVDGQIPGWLRGTLFRNGPARNQLGGEWFAHWFDGDGMISAIRFDGAGVHYANRYVRTENYVAEGRAGRILNRGFGKMRPWGILGNAFRLPANVSNTSVLTHGGRLLSLWEGGPPFAIEPDTLHTRGIEDFGGQVRAFSAHPKIDPETGDIYNFGIDYGRRTTLTPYRLGASGLTRFAPIPLPYPLMNHDFVLTRRHLVFCLGPILLHSVKMLLGLSSFDAALHWERSRPTLVLLVPRDGSAPRWIETEPFFQFHFANGYEDQGALVIDLVRYADYACVGEALRNFWRSDWPADGMGQLTRLRVDLASGKTSAATFDAGAANEFPRIDPRRVGRRHRYVYLAGNPPDRRQGWVQRLTRLDAESGAGESHDFAPDGYPGEPVFIPASPEGDEDDGVVVSLVYDAASHRSSVVGLDARNLSGKPLFTARLRHHVPFSLHGMFAPW